MKAYFKLEGRNRPVLVLEPSNGDEAILMAAFIRHDANQFLMYVERSESGSIQRCELLADQSQ